MKLREVEVGGVYNIGNYQNVRVAVRVAVSESPGMAVAEALRWARNVAFMAVVVRKLEERAGELERIAEENRREARRNEEEAREIRKRAREDASEKLATILPNLKDDLKKALEKEPELAWKLGILDSSCVRVDWEHYEKEAEKRRLAAEEAEKEAKKLRAKADEIYGALEAGDLEKALKIAKESATKLSIPATPPFRHSL